MTEIDVSKIRIPMNYVLVELDKDFEVYHNTETGLNTGIYVAPLGPNKAHHFAVTGTVITMPHRLNYSGYRLKKLKDEKDRAEYKQKIIAEVRHGSIAYDVPMEPITGYKVFFDYTTRKNAEADGRWIESGGKNYILVRYDHLIFAFKLGTNFSDIKINDVYPLNGFLLIKPLEYATFKGEKMPEGVKTESDLFLPASAEAKYIQQGNVWWANVLACGDLVRDYVDFPNAGADNEWFGKPGQKIAFDGRHKIRLERPEHRVIFKQHTLYRIHRKDILCVYPDGNIAGKQILNKQVYN